MSKLYKIYHVTNENVNKCFVFVGDKQLDDGTKTKDLSNLFKKDPEHKLFKLIFDEKEFESITKNGILVEFVPLAIYADDTIEIVKRKLLSAVKEEYSYEEIYLFVETTRMIDPQKMYKSLTQREKVELTKKRFIQYLTNIPDVSLEEVSDKDTYNYSDIISLNLNSKEHIFKVSLGQKLMVEDHYPCSVNPFDVLTFDEFLEQYGETIVSTENKNLLFEVGEINNNVIYFTDAENVFKHMNQNKINEETACKIYFPFLYEYGIKNLSALERGKQTLLERNKLLIDKRFEKQMQNVDLFYNMFYTRTEEMEYIEKGIKTFHCILHPTSQVNIPLDSIFKLLHASRDMPFIKLNHSARKEKVYRLYSEKVSTSGKKIPYLDKTTILTLKKTVGKVKSVSAYISKDYKGDRFPVIVEIDSLANISILVEASKGYLLEEITEIISSFVNPLINVIKEFLENSGYEFNLFSDLYDPNIEVLRILFYNYLTITKNISLKKIIGCLSSVFNVIVDDLNNKDGSILQFKRVSNFNEMDAQEAFIIEQINLRTQYPDIISMLERNFELSREDAELKIAAFINDVQVEMNAFEGKKKRIKNNPGFPIVIKKEPFKNNILIEVDKINDIKYLFTIPIYIDSLLRITQKSGSSKVNKKEISSTCLKKKQEGAIVMNEIKINAEKKLLEKEEEEDDVIEWSGVQDDGDNLIDMMLEMDEEEEDDYEDEELTDSKTGGNSATSSSNSASINLSDLSSIGDIQEDSDESEESVDDNTSTSKSIEFNIPKLEREPSAQSSMESSIDIDDLDESLEDLLQKEKSESKASEKSEESIPSVESDESDIVEEELTGDITGLTLSNPYYFFDRMVKRDPALFLKKQDGKFKAYSRICPSNIRRQPVILTEKEKQKIDREHPGSYTNTFKYGSSPDKQFYYICPKYWCLSKNVSLTEEEVQRGECGGQVIPFSAKKVPKGKHIYQFSAEEGSFAAKEWLDPDGKYIEHHPGFVKEGSHPDDLGIPCCFKTWDSPEQERRRQVFLENKKVKKKAIEKEDYIKGPEKFPLDNGRYGYLPVSVQKFLHTDNTKCYVSDTNKNIKVGKVCYIRRGVELNKKKSFIATISYIIVNETHMKDKEPPTIAEMIEIIINAIDIDKFITYQNGNLPEIFSDPERKISIDKYKDSELYKKYSEKKEDIYKSILYNTAAAYERFIEYLRDPEETVSYKYLWDIICEPNPKLFTKGINLIILNMPNDDVTDNIELICPSNSYSSSKFVKQKQSLLLVKQEDFFEPVIRYVNLKKNKIAIMKLFSLNSPVLEETMRYILKIIEQLYNSKCNPLRSVVEYKFKNAIGLIETLNILKEEKDYSLLNQVINYKNKVIGVIVSVKGISGFLPCRPSGMIIDIPYITMDDDIWTNYTNTVNFLKFINKEFKKQIPCLPVMKVIEEELVVGIITETNQFIMLSEPEENIITDGLHEIKDRNFLMLDKNTHHNKSIDTERQRYVKKIKLETKFFTVFRNLCKILLNKYEYRNIRKTIEELFNNPSILYYDKINQIVTQLKTLMNEYLEFAEYDDKLINEIEDVTKCINISSEDCKERSFCMTVIGSSDNICKLIIPKVNLINNKNNEVLYFNRIADEIIRFGQIRMFLFKPQNYLSLDAVDYKLNENEIILLDTLLNIDYFDNMIESETQKYISYSTFDDINPLKTAPYTNKEELDTLLVPTTKTPIEKEIVKEESRPACVVMSKNKIHIDLVGKIKTMMPKKSFEQKYKNVEPCSFEILIQILYASRSLEQVRNIDDSVFTISSLKKILVNEYSQLLDKNKDPNFLTKLIILFQNERKSMPSIKLLKKNNITIDEFILSDNYYLTSIDFFLLSMYFNIQLLLLTLSSHDDDNKSITITNINDSTSYSIIRVSGLASRTGYTKYSLLGYKKSREPVFVFDYEQFPKNTQAIITNNRKIDSYTALIDMINSQVLPKRLVVKKK